MTGAKRLDGDDHRPATLRCTPGRCYFLRDFVNIKHQLEVNYVHNIFLPLSFLICVHSIAHKLITVQKKTINRLQAFDMLSFVKAPCGLDKLCFFLTR